jgi:dTDP-4-dehydrorhamnose 3,5-epimerase
MESIRDDRGFFARIWCADEFASNGLNMRLEQCSVSFNKVRGTLRGMHYQTSPNMEAKLVRCSKGAAYDVIVDARRGSPTEGKHFCIKMSQDEPTMLYVPEGVAHGFITLADETEMTYMISAPYIAKAQAGFRWDDREVGIKWPLQPVQVSIRDAALPAFACRRIP